MIGKAASYQLFGVLGFILLRTLRLPVTVRFADCGVAGGYVNPTGESPEAKGPYVRPMSDLDVSTEGDKQKVFDVLGALNNLAVRMKVDGEAKVEDTTDTATFIKELRARANVHLYTAAGA